MKKYIVVTGGAGFVGSNLIKNLLLYKKFNIISLDNYSTGSKYNHLKSKKVNYLNGNTKDISTILNRYKKNINTIFHFGEFSRIYQSFLKMNECIESNTLGTHSVFNFCMSNDIKLIYSATSASLGNYGEDKNLSPYAFSKAKNLEMLNNLKKWFNFKFEIIYFYNVYGPNQITNGNMATVVGIFQDHYLKKKPLPVVLPGTQTRRFTHIDDTIKVCIEAWKKNKRLHYSISSKEVFSINKLAKLFKTKIRYLPKRKGERFASALTKMNLSNKVYKRYGKIRLKDYISEFIESNYSH